MIPEKAKARIEELSREELIGLLNELMNSVHQLVEQLRLKKSANELEEFLTAAIAGFQGREKEAQENQKEGRQIRA